MRPPGREALQYFAAGLGAMALCIALGAAIAAVGNGPVGPDAGWLDFWHDHRSPALTAISLWLNTAGSRLYLGYVIPIAIAIVLLIRRRPVAAAAFIAAGLLDAPAVNVVKSVLLRPRPPHPSIDVTLTAYPSGHVANLVVLLALVGFALTPRHRRWWWPVALVLTFAMAFSRTYLDAHWLTDVLGGTLLGAGVAAVLWSIVAWSESLRPQHPKRNRSSRIATKTR